MCLTLSLRVSTHPQGRCEVMVNIAGRQRLLTFTHERAWRGRARRAACIARTGRARARRAWRRRRRRRGPAPARRRPRRSSWRRSRRTGPASRWAATRCCRTDASRWARRRSRSRKPPRCRSSTTPRIAPSVTATLCKRRLPECIDVFATVSTCAWFYLVVDDSVTRCCVGCDSLVFGICK